ncbi:MAG: ABC transporter permease [Rhodothermales bacterium]
MLKNYIKVALRNLQKHRGYASINIIGLAVGLACATLMLLFIRHELSYDQFHEKSDRIYRVYLDGLGGEGRQIAVTPSALAHAFRQDYPEIETAVRLYDPTRYRPMVMRNGSAVYREEGFVYADSTFFETFSFDLIHGQKAGALTQPNTVILTASMAQKYFGTQNPVGQTLEAGSSTFEVIGVTPDTPENSHFSFNFLASYVTLANWSEASDDTWRAANFFTYVVLNENAPIRELEQKMDILVERVAGDMMRQAGMSVSIGFEPMRDIHLRSEVEGGMQAQGDIRYVYGLLALVVLVLVIACINYMNLATARAARRAREVGMRKALGAARGQLLGQFFGESAVLVGLGLVAALALAALTVPFFNTLTAKSFAVADVFTPSMLALTIGIGVLVTFIAGSYPALILSGMQPMQVLKGSFKADPKAALTRKGLVVFQFAISGCIIIGTTFVVQQLQYIQQQNLGFDQEQVMMLDLPAELRRSTATVKTTLEALPNVQSAAAMSDYPSRILGGYSGTVEGRPDQSFSSIGYRVDPDALETLDFTLVAGSGMSPNHVPNEDRSGHQFILNETAVRNMQFEPSEAIGRSYNLNGRDGEIVGVVADFHFASLKETIEPLTLFAEGGGYNFVAVRLVPGNISAAVEGVQNTIAELAPGAPFSFAFLDDQFDALYREEQRVAGIVSAFAGFAILIACLGLFGLAAFIAEQRTKEIGVRKVLGASVPSIVVLLTKDFALLIGVAFAIGAPVGYLFVSNWLENFAYRIDVGLMPFVLTAIGILLVAGLTVSYQAIKSAIADPIKALRYE